MTSQEACREFHRRCQHLFAVKARLVMLTPVDYVLANGELAPVPRPSDEVTKAIEYIDEIVAKVAKECAGMVHDDANEMTQSELANLDRLYEECRRGREEDGGKWPEYTGPGK